MLQTVLTGKAQKAYASLSNEDAKDYGIVKQTILRAYELIPEAYRQKFRSWKKARQQSHLEFSKEKGMLFDKWCNSEEVTTFEAMREMILIEEFKNCVNPHIRTYLDERMPRDLAEAAKLADQYDLS